MSISGLLLIPLLIAHDWASPENLVKTSTTVVVNQFRSSGGMDYAEAPLTTSQISAVTDGKETTCHTEKTPNIVVVEAKKKMILKIEFEKICSRVAEITVQGEFFPLKQTSDVVMVLCNGLLSTTHGCTSQLLNSSCGSITCRQTLTFTCAKPQKKVRRLEVRMYFSQLKKIADIKLCEITVAPFPTSKSTSPPFPTTSPPSSAVATTFGQTTVQPTSALRATSATSPTKNQCPDARWKYISSPGNCSSLTSCKAEKINHTLACVLSSSEDQILENSQCCDSISKPPPEYDECSFSCSMIWSEWSPCSQSGPCDCGTRVRKEKCMQWEMNSNEKKLVRIRECRLAGVVNAVKERENCSCFLNLTVAVNASACHGDENSQNKILTASGTENDTSPTRSTEGRSSEGSLGTSIGVSTAVSILLLVLLVFAIVFLRRKNRRHSEVKVTVEMSTLQEPAVSVLEESATLPLTPTNSVHVTEINNEQCTAYAKITAVKLDAFPRRSAILLEDGGLELHEEFQSLDSIGKSKSTSFGKDRDNIHKNRYKNTVPYDDNRIILDEVEGLSIPETDYINASYIDGFCKPKEFIACQGPLTSTCSDMWRMVWSESASTIVMLCGFMENGRVKCERYWSDDQMETYDGLTVKVIEIQGLATYTVRKMRLQLEKDDDVRYVTHYHFKSWLDHDTPKHPNSLLGMIRHLQRERKPGRLIVHCSAGVGRTGTFLAILTMMSRVDAGKSVDIRGYVGVIRTKRMQMVQTLDQYRFIYMAVRNYVMGRFTELRVEAFKKETKDFRYGNSTFLNTVKEQYDLLEAVSPKCDESLYLAALSLPVEVAKTKNRSLDILPPDSSSVYLRCDAVEPAYANVGNGSYINASYIDSYYKRDGFIVTQYPMEGTIADFWRMIFQKSAVAIVNLTPPNEEEPYWPTTGHSTYGACIVQFESFSDMQGYSVTELKIAKESSSLIVNLYHYRSWPEDGHPEESPDLFRLMKEVEIWQQYHDSAPIVVHCSTGVGRSGAFCATWNVIDQIENEKVVNIFDAAKLVRNQRPGIISSLTYYESIWFNVVNYVRSRDVYANI